MTMMASQPAAAPSAPSGGGAGPELFRGFSALSSRLTDRLKESGLDNLVAGVKNFLPAQKDQTVTRVVGALMDPGTANAQALQESDAYLFFDPKQALGRRGGAAGVVGTATVGGSKARQSFNEVIVFIVGGGSYLEHANLQDYAARLSGGVAPGATGANLGPAAGAGAGGSGASSTNASAAGAGIGATGGAAHAHQLKRITYGATEILSPHEFVAVLANLADKSG